MTLHANAAETEREHVGAQKHHRAHFRFGQRLTETAAMTADEVDLQFEQFIGRDPNIGEFSETGVDPVNDISAFNDRVNDAARCHPLAAARPH